MSGYGLRIRDAATKTVMLDTSMSICRFVQQIDFPAQGPTVQVQMPKDGRVWYMAVPKGYSGSFPGSAYMPAIGVSSTNLVSIGVRSVAGNALGAVDTTILLGVY